MKKLTKKEIYAEYGIVYDGNNHIYHEKFGFIPCLLVNGNSKIGKGVWHFSTLPTNQIFSVIINGMSFDVKGTCPCTCKGCYATKGNFRYQNVKDGLAIKTLLIREDLDFVKRAIIAQIKAENIEFVRLHASGDFDSIEYIEMIKEVVKECKTTTFWTYTKNDKAVNAFDEFDNANIVKSIIPHFGFNFGHCDYILAVYKELKKQGNSVYICRCGIDKNQHCTNCKGCSKNEFVLFIEHSTEYKAETDPCFEELKALIESQEKQ